MPRLAYWDQEDHDKAMHLIQQKRDLTLSLGFRANNGPLAQKRVQIYVARSMVEGCDEFHEYLLNNEGQLEFTLQYGESLIDVELDNQSLHPKSDIDKVTFHWFHPGKWFKRLKIHRDLSNWAIRLVGEPAADVIFEVTFDPILKPNSASVSFSNLLGHIFEGPKMGSYPEASISIPAKGHALFTFHMRSFFDKWMKNFSKPFELGDEYPVELTLGFNTPFEVNPSSQKDPKFIPKTYDGRVDHADGNPYIGVPSTTPESSIQIYGAWKLTLTSEMLPG